MPELKMLQLSSFNDKQDLYGSMRDSVCNPMSVEHTTNAV